MKRVLSASIVSLSCVALLMSSNAFASVFRFFSELNYVEQRLDELIGTNQSPENHLFVPR